MRSSAGSTSGARIIAGGFGLGWIPRAPGTAASAAATLVGAGLIAVSPWLLAAALLIALGGGLWAISRAAPAADPGWVVIDEIAGQWIALFAAPRPDIPLLLAGFLLFRLFDILKPGPVKLVERLPGALGVMADDVLAGLIALVILLLVRLVPGAPFRL